MWPYTAVTCSPRCKGIYCKESGIAEERTKKASKTCLERYGSDNPGKVPEFREAMTEKLLANYGVTHALKSSVILDKVKETNRKNFGTDWASQNEDVKRRYREKMVEKYGVDNYWKSSEHIVSMMSDPSKADNYLSFKEDPLGFILSRYSEKPTVVEICKDVGVTDTIIYNIINSAGVSEYVDHYRSKFESQIIDKLLEICPSIEIVEHDRLNIKPKELDIYLPEYSLAIECNPTYTHNSSFPTAWVPGVLPYDYHKKKTELCEAKGIRLFHIFGYQWTNKREIVVSMLRNLLKKNLRTVYARNTVVRNVSGAESMKFLDENHIQGRTQSAVRLGLYVGEELISLMTFSKPRHGSGYSKKYDDNTWELTRFCTKLNTTCVGGASKLFKYFLNEHSPSQVVSFSDRSITSGNLYEVLGFQNVGYVSPGYVWVKLQDDSYYSRVACQKQNLSKLLHEPDLDIVNQTEAQIMEGHGYARVYNSGLVKWQFCN